LEPVDTLVIATDGIEESMNLAGEQFGSQRLFSAVRNFQPCPAANIIARLNSEVGTFTSGARQRDDITAIVAVVG
jgi:serine phosphatase RsbU (regulator of sigma subunit)